VIEPEKIQLRAYGQAALPALIYLPGLHGDWTLVSSFRTAIAPDVRFVEFTYPRTITWSLEDYARGVIDALLKSGIRTGWLLGESFSSQVVWQICEIARKEKSPSFTPAGIILAGGFAQYPIPMGVRVVRFINARMPPWMIRAALQIYASYARLRHRRAPETRASIDEFIARRTELDRQAIVHRYGLILASRAEEMARCCRLPVYALYGFIDPVVPWLFVLPWLRRNCPGFRQYRVIFNADHNVLGTAPHECARQIRAWMTFYPPAPELQKHLDVKENESNDDR
jgi:pimeloyl-ACP methyl ester carboxylesterase